MRRTYLSIFLALSLLSSGWVQASMVPGMPVSSGEETTLTSQDVPDCHRQSSEQAGDAAPTSLDEGCCETGAQCGCASLCQSASVFENETLSPIVYSMLKERVQNDAQWASLVPEHLYRPPIQAI